jgi:hypothetical protein
MILPPDDPSSTNSEQSPEVSDQPEQPPESPQADPAEAARQQLLDSPPEPEPQEPEPVSPESDSPEREDAAPAGAGEEQGLLVFDEADKDSADLAKVKLDWLPEEHQPKVRKFLGEVQGLLSQKYAEAEKLKTEAGNRAQSLKAAEDRLLGLAEALEKDGGDPKAVESSQVFIAQQKVNDLLIADINGTAWEAFDALYGDGFKALPSAAKAAFGRIVEGGDGKPARLMELGGANMLQRLERAMQEACKEAGCKALERGGARPAAPAKDPQEAKRQAALGGSRPTGDRVRKVEDESWDDLMSRHDHLLG